MNTLHDGSGALRIIAAARTYAVLLAIVLMALAASIPFTFIWRWLGWLDYTPLPVGIFLWTTLIVILLIIGAAICDGLHARKMQRIQNAERSGSRSAWDYDYTDR